MNNLKIGVIGCGKQAYKHIRSIKKIPGADIVVHDIVPQLAHTMAKTEDVSFVDDVNEIFEDGKVEAVVICTPTQTHFELIIKALKNNLHVFCEKPLSDKINEIKDIKKAEIDTNLVMMIGYIYRFVPVFEEGYRIFTELQAHGESLITGRALNAFFRLGGRGSHQIWKHLKEDGGGAINEMLVHMIDLANWYFGPLRDVEIISCCQYLHQRTIRGKTIDVDAEDYILIKCTGKNGVEILCQADLITPAFNQYVEIQCENGSFRGSIQQDSPSYLFLNEARGGFDQGKTNFSFGQRNLLDYQMLYFVHSILSKTKADKNTVADSLQLTTIIDRIRNLLSEGS